MSDSEQTGRYNEPGADGLMNLIRARRISRRQVLTRGLALGLSVPVLSALMAACGSDEAEDPTATTASGADPTATTAAGDATPGEATATSGTGGGTPVDGGTLTIIQTGSIPDMDPQSAYDSDASALFFGTYEMLLRLQGSDTFEYEPMLADAWESNEDQTEWTFTIPDGILFHDGTTCDAEAVASSMKRFHEMGLGPVNVITRFVESPDDITAVDANTVSFKLIYGTDIFLAAMASQYGPLIISPTAIEENATAEDPFAHEWARSNMVGTGPYKLKENELGNFVVLDRFEEFHGGWDGNHFDEIIFRNIEDSTTRRQLMESGEADAITQNLTPDDVTEMETAGQLTVLRYETTNANWLAFNYGRLPDPNVRKALAYAYPYADVREQVYRGLIIASSGACTPTTRGYPTDGFIYETDLEMAKQLLDEAGFDYGQELEYMISSGQSEERAAAELFQANLAEIGVNVSITELEEGQQTDLMYGSAPAEEKPHFVDWGWWPDYNDAWNQLYPNFATASITPNGSNALYYSNTEVDDLLDQSATMSAGAEYDQVIADINRIMVEEDPAAAFYGSLNWYTILAANIEGFVPNPIYINTYNIYDMYRVE